jgi:hypothetical protein
MWVVSIKLRSLYPAPKQPLGVKIAPRIVLGDETTKKSLAIPGRKNRLSCHSVCSAIPYSV